MMALGRLVAVAVLLAGLGAASCKTSLEPGDLEGMTAGTVRMFYNHPGPRQGRGQDALADDILIQLLDRATATLDVCVMGFSRTEVIDAVERAHHRGVAVRFVGDSEYLGRGTQGYVRLEELGIPSITGNQYHIMHNKFFVIDSRFVVTGTGNITPTGFERNDNNWVVIDSPHVVADFTDEFEQLFAGRFGSAKQPIENGNTYVVGDTTVEVFFSPQEPAMGRILEYIGQARYSIDFWIFAFTKDEVGSGFIDKHLEFSSYNRCCDPASRADIDTASAAECALWTCEEPFVERGVRGVIDRSQLHSNGPYHEAYRLLTWGVPVRMDGNNDSYQAGDYQAGGGRQHAKTMVIDAGTPYARVLTGSFNWSSSATVANDETLVVLHGERIADEFMEQFEELWTRGQRIGNAHLEEGGGVRPGDLVFNEIHWDGWNGLNDPSDFGGDDVYNDEFIELLNTTDQPIDLSMWTVASPSDFIVGIYPGTIIGPYEHFLILDHNLEPFQDLDPQDQPHAFEGADFVMNMANDPRFLRLNLHNAAFSLRLVDPRGNVADVAGDGGPPFWGGRASEGGRIRNRSMERVHGDCGGDPACIPVGPGDQPASWEPCDASRGGVNVRESFRDVIIATPGEPNSGGEPSIGAEDPMFRSPTGQRQ